MPYKYSTIRQHATVFKMDDMVGHRLVMVKRRDPVIHVRETDAEWQGGCECKWRSGVWRSTKKAAEYDREVHLKEARRQGAML